jgi:poly-gamma-glutamate synthesis protein (capsule biosynthesis protein)
LVAALLFAALVAAVAAPGSTAAPRQEPSSTPLAQSDPSAEQAAPLEISEVEQATRIGSVSGPRPDTGPVADQEADAGSTPDPEPTRGRLVINGAGDVNVDPGYIPALATEGYEHALSGLEGLFIEDDLSVINLECPASDLGTRVPKQFNFRCDTEALPVLEALGVDVANQGNNHSLDYGPDALLDSIDNIEAAGMAAVGAGANAAEAHAPAVFELNGWTVAVIGFGGVIPSMDWIATESSPGMADGDTIETMVAAVEAADEVADLVVVTIHWGVELQTGPPQDDVARAQAMIDAGADMIFGHHPHRLNALETYEGKPIAWSLGNFVWPRLSAAGSDTAVAQVIVEPDGSISSCLLDVTIISGGHPTLDDPTRHRCDTGPADPTDPVDTAAAETGSRHEAV